MMNGKIFLTRNELDEWARLACVSPHWRSHWHRHLKISFQVFLRQIFSAKFFKFSYLWLLLLHIVYSISAIAHWLAQTWLAQTWF